ncbi:chorismate--pyruvate lyase family protein [Colwellia echini]|uniref:Probable chorismate pyruvate-lyase n=1 Tax=Colwellia echini TaxID=1982103 RepID=A0ABY3MT10_9GAMM|nr:chorismate lyase [Colwellia echini]TYK64337.1 chorismate lyase [Colwellia echini]
MNQDSINFPVTLSGQWKSPNDQQVAQLPENLKSWLLDESSLTARLKSHCRTFHVKVIGEVEQLCTADEACDLIKVGEPILVREVLLFCDNVPQVFARSLLPLTSLTGKEVVLGHLGAQPLGQVLFNNPSLQRQALQVSSFTVGSRISLLADSLAKQNTVAQTPIDINKELWGRRSIFILENKPLLVAEVFLPGALAYHHNRY